MRACVRQLVRYRARLCVSCLRARRVEEVPNDSRWIVPSEEDEDTYTRVARTVVAATRIDTLEGVWTNGTSSIGRLDVSKHEHRRIYKVSHCSLAFNRSFIPFLPSFLPLFLASSVSATSRFFLTCLSTAHFFLDDT